MVEESPIVMEPILVEVIPVVETVPMGLRQRKKSKAADSKDTRKRNISRVEKEKTKAVMVRAGIATNVAIYRVIFFSIMLHEWCTHIPNFPLHGDIQDTWMSYDQFQFFFDLAPKVGHKDAEFHCIVILYFGIVCGVLAVVGGISSGPRVVPFEFPAALFTLAYAIRFLTVITRFSNHHYLYLLIMILMTFSGGGSLYSKNVDATMVRRCQWASLNIRYQYAVVYLFASLWKVHADWLDGSIVRGIFLSFEEAGVNRGVRWSAIEEAFPSVFFFVAIGGFLLDFGMFLALTLYRPTSRNRFMFVLASIFFHGFVTYTMSQRIGYSFPATCLLGTILYAPFDEDASDSKGKTSKNKGKRTKPVPLTKEQLKSADSNLLYWMYRYAKGSLTTASLWQRRFTMVWVFWQVIFPLRMVAISGGNFAFTGQGYRFSWTMMLHSRASNFAHKAAAKTPDGKSFDKILPIQLVYIEPRCHGKPILRSEYFPGSENDFEDPKTIPLHTHLLGTVRNAAAIEVYPRHIARVAGGFADALTTSNHKCDIGALTMHTTHFAQLNGKGPYSRLFDPTVDMVAAEQARKKRSFLQTWHDVTLDVAPKGHEYLLKGVGSLRQKALLLHFPLLKKMIYSEKGMNTVRIEVVADRAACLSSSPIKLIFNQFPMTFLLMESPSNLSLTGYVGEESQTVPLSIGQPQQLQVDTLEISVVQEFGMATCGETTKEDVLFAMVFMI